MIFFFTYSCISKPRKKEQNEIKRKDKKKTEDHNNFNNSKLSWKKDTKKERKNVKCSFF